MTPTPPLMLLTNDDGIYAPGLQELRRTCSELGSVAVVAPDGERSAFGHAITMAKPLRAAEVVRGGVHYGTAVSGTPADCVKLALHTLLPGYPRLVVSGINHGPNTGTNVLYSGTVSAAREGTIFNLPSLAVSLKSYEPDADFSVAAAYARHFARLILEHGLPEGVMLNLNVPYHREQKIKGVRLTRLARYRYRDRYEIRKDPRGRSYYWLAGEDAEVLNPAPDIDAIALDAGFVSLTPLNYQLTCDAAFPALAEWVGAGDPVF